MWGEGKEGTSKESQTIRVPKDTDHREALTFAMGCCQTSRAASWFASSPSPLVRCFSPAVASRPLPRSPPPRSRLLPRRVPARSHLARTPAPLGSLGRYPTLGLEPTEQEARDGERVKHSPSLRISMYMPLFRGRHGP